MTARRFPPRWLWFFTLAYCRVSLADFLVLATYLSYAARKPQHLCAIRQYYLIVSRRRQGEWQRDIATAQSPRGLCIVSPGAP
jgi:hypothetical protein